MIRETDSGDLPVVKALVDVKRSEVALLLVSMLWIFAALTAYYIIKPIRGTVLQTLIGVDNKSTALLLSTAFVGVFAFAYGNIVPRVARRALVIGTFAAHIGCLSAFAFALPAGREMAGGSRLVGYLFFIWVSTFNLMIVSQFWSVATEVWTKEQGVRLFGTIGIGGVAGGIFGTAVVSKLAARLAVVEMLMLSAAILGLCLGLALFVLGRLARRRDAAAPASAPARAATPGEPSAAAPSALGLVLASPYLRLVALMMLLVNVANSNYEWVLDKTVQQAQLGTAGLNAFYGEYYLFQNVITFCIQVFVTANVQRRFGARGALFFEPTVGIIGGLAFLIAPTLGVIKWHKIFENACEYSIQSNTRELLYVPTTPIEKYSAKNLNDTFLVRAGDALAAGAIYVAANFVVPKLGTGGLKLLVVLTLAASALWLVVAARIGALHKARMGTVAATGGA